jgi:hypothetical protein
MLKQIIDSLTEIYNKEGDMPVIMDCENLAHWEPVVFMGYTNKLLSDGQKAIFFCDHIPESMMPVILEEELKKRIKKEAH